MLKSDLCDYSDAYIIVKRTTDLLAVAANWNDKSQKNVAFTNNAPFRSCISKINNTLTDNAEDLNIAMLKYQEVYGIIIETKLIVLMIMPRIRSHLNIKKKQK